MVMFGIETFGSFSKEGKDFLKSCACLSVLNNSFSHYSVVLRHMIQQISVALQMANFKSLAKLLNINSSSFSSEISTSSKIIFSLVASAI